MARHGENIRKRNDGRWEGRYKVFDEKRGRTIYRSLYGKTYEEVKEKLFLARSGLAGPDLSGGDAGEKTDGMHNMPYPDGTVLFSQAAEQWLVEIKKKRKYSTYAKYDTVYRMHLEKQAGLCVLSAEKAPECFAKIFDHLSKKELSGSMQKSICCVANQIFHFANKNYSSNVPVLERPPVTEKKKSAPVLSGAEQKRLLGCIYNRLDRLDPFGAAVLLCLHTGLRLGELCALKWEDLDLGNRILTVNRTVQRITVKGCRTKTVLMETDPKSESSRRIIPLAAEMAGLLARLNTGRPYVFGGEKPLEPRTMQYRFRKMLRKSKIDSRKFHALRHTFATNCVENGMDVKSLSELLGHSDVKITLNRYVHPTMDSKRKQMDSLSNFYGQICGQVA